MRGCTIELRCAILQVGAKRRRQGDRDVNDVFLSGAAIERVEREVDILLRLMVRMCTFWAAGFCGRSTQADRISCLLELYISTGDRDRQSSRAEADRHVLERGDVNRSILYQMATQDIIVHVLSRATTRVSGFTSVYVCESVC